MALFDLFSARTQPIFYDADPTRGRSAGAGNAVASGVIAEYLNQNYPAAFNYVFGNMLQGSSPLARYLRSRADDYLGQYQAAVVDRPNLSVLDFLKGLNPQAEFLALSPGQRGLDRSRFSPRVVQKPFGFL